MPGPRSTSSAVPLGKHLQSRLWRVTTSDSGVRKHPSKNRGRPPKAKEVLPQSEIDRTDTASHPSVMKAIPNSTEIRPLELEIIPVLRRTISAPEGISSRWHPPLTSIQKISLLKFMEKVVRPALQVSIRSFTSLHPFADLHQCANAVTIEISWNHLPSVLPTSNDLSNRDHRKAVKKLVKRLFGERILSLQTVHNPPANRAAQSTEDLSSLDAGQSAAINLQNQSDLLRQGRIDAPIKKALKGMEPTPNARFSKRQAKIERQQQRQARILRSQSIASRLSRESVHSETCVAKATIHPEMQAFPSRNALLPSPLVLPAHLTKELGHARAFNSYYSSVDAAQDGYYLARTSKWASGDIITGAWHSDSNRYIAGATATTDNLNLHYNRPQNLLFGNVEENTLQELSDHYVDAPLSKIAMTVETARIAGEQMYTASHDKTIKIWDIANDPVCSRTIHYNHHALLLEVSKSSNILAVGIKDTGDSIHVYNTNSQSLVLGSSRARAKPRQEIYPSSLAWGPSPQTQNLLLAGFLRWGELPDGGLKKEGHLCLWDVATAQELIIKPSAQGVYTTAWCSRVKGFAAGGIPGLQLSNKQMQSVVRVWDIKASLGRWMMEFECPARDQGEVLFHPRDDNLLVVACTNGTSYIYDCRNPDSILHHLQHGDPIENNWIVDGLDSVGQTREEGDGGVMLCQWGNGRNLLYTGSSDGVLKSWDVHRASEDVFIQDISRLDSGITFGSFSPDHSKLLVGDASGGIHMISNDQRDGLWTEDRMVPRQTQLLHANGSSKTHDAEGISLANKAIFNRQIVIDKRLGALQGPKYQGPYNAIDIHQPIDQHARAALLEQRRQNFRASRRPVKRSISVRSRGGSLMSPPVAKRHKHEAPRSAAVEIIDLTDEPEEEPQTKGRNSKPYVPTRDDHQVYVKKELTTFTSSAPTRKKSGISRLSEKVESLTQDEILEDDHWFPDEDPMAIGCFVGGNGVKS